MKKPLVSVLLPVRNGAPFVGAAVRSILDQSEGSLELLLLDDGSSDGSLEAALAAAQGDPRLRPVRLKGRGLVAALNRGLKLAQGSFIARMDADDLSLPRRLELQLLAFERDPSLGVLGGDFRVLGRPWKRHRFQTAPADIKVAALFDSPLAHPTVMFRASLVRRLGGYRAAFKHAEDYELWSRWLSQGVRFSNLGIPLIRYRQHAGQVSQARREAQRRMVRRVRDRWLAELGLKPSAAETIIHEGLSERVWPRGQTGLTLCEDWLLKLARANGKKKVFEALALEQALAGLWAQALWANRGSGAWLRRLAAASPLAVFRHARPWKKGLARLGASL